MCEEALAVMASKEENKKEEFIKEYFFKGDIIPPDNWRYFNCECKFYKDFKFSNNDDFEIKNLFCFSNTFPVFRL